MSMVIQDLATTRKEALVGLLKFFMAERMGLVPAGVSLVISEPEPKRAEELQLAAPYLVKPTHLKTLFVVRQTKNDKRSVAFAVSGGYITVGVLEDPDAALFAGSNIFIYHYEKIGYAANATIDFLLSQTEPFDRFEGMLGLNGIANYPGPAKDESFSLPA